MSKYLWGRLFSILFAAAVVALAAAGARAQTNPQNGRSRLDQQSALTLVQNTRRGGGRDTPKPRQQKDVTILDVFGNAASVKIVASDWIDYLHVAKFNGRWVIVNVLWELKPAKN